MSTVDNPLSYSHSQRFSSGAIRNRLATFQWPRSWWLNLAFAAVIGGSYAIGVMGPGAINPRNIRWLTPDGATHQIAWELYRQDPKLHWPITFTDRIGVPQGESMSLMDPDPLLAVLLKPFSRFLPEPFQYQGIEAVLVCTLQLFFALLLFRVLLGPDPFAVLLPALFFLIAPSLTWRLGVSHFALSNHWLLLAALLTLCIGQRSSPDSTRRFVCYAVLLSGIAVAINPYLALQVLLLLSAGVITLLWQRRVTLMQATAVVIAMGGSSVFAAAAFGLIIGGGHGYAADGYRSYSLNLLSLFDPQTSGSLFFWPLPRLVQQYEGFNYLGLGAIILALVALPLPFLHRPQQPLPGRRVVLPVCASCLVSTVMALSTKITLGSLTLIDVDPKQTLTPFLSALRASGRLFWAPYYVLLGVTVAFPFVFLRKRLAVLVVTAALVLQIADTSGLRHWARSQNGQHFGSPLRSPVWSRLGEAHKNLMIMPAWQCGPNSTPGGMDGFRVFGFLAASQRMGTNSYYAARYTEINRKRECGDVISNLSRVPLKSASAYVVSPSLAKRITEGPSGTGKCHSVDGLILCFSKADFDLDSILSKGSEDLQNAIADASFEDEDLSDWSTYQDVRAYPSSARAHSGRQSLAESDGAGSVYEDVSGLKPEQLETVTAWISASSDATATAQIGVWDPDSNVSTFSAPMNPGKGWHVMKYSFVAGRGGRARIHLFRNQGLGTIFWDDVNLYGDH